MKYKIYYATHNVVSIILVSLLQICGHVALHSCFTVKMHHAKNTVCFFLQEYDCVYQIFPSFCLVLNYPEKGKQTAQMSPDCCPLVFW